MNNLPIDIINNIISYNNTFGDIIGIKYINKYYYNVFNNWVNSIIFLKNGVNINSINDYVYNIYEKDNTSNYDNLIIINDIKQLNFINPKNIRYLNLSNYNRYNKFGDEFIWFSEDVLKLFVNVRFLNISGMILSYIPKNLTNLVYLNISDNNITRIPKELINLKILISCSSITDGLNYIPSNILENLNYLECCDCLRHDVILNKEKIKYAIIKLNYDYMNNYMNIHVNDYVNINKKLNVYIKNNQNFIELCTTNNVDVYVYESTNNIN